MNSAIKNKLVLVTGSSSGFGREIALEYARQGAYIALHGRDEKRLKIVKAIIEKENGTAHYFISDLSDNDKIDFLISEIKIKFKKEIYVLVNCAGIAILGAINDIPNSQYDYIIKLNVLAPIILTKLVLPRMFENGGRIINITSGVGVLGLPCLSAYSLSKAAFTAFSESLYFETISTKVDVVTVSPGLMKTKFSNNIKHFGLMRNAFSNGKFLAAELIAKKIIVKAHSKKNFINYSRSRIVGVMKYCAPFLLRKLIQLKFSRIY